MSEKKSKNIFIVVYVALMTLLLSMSSCGTSQLTQEQIKINYELDRLWIDYQYKSDSLINKFYENGKTNSNN
mgnify:FL=1|jgi:uncharacterized lipoprotein YehR (DUF1307 family)|tara:strand:- start:131 stop:346 length:216 start_codon:yes stop_codon:yes gene_type:complete